MKATAARRAALRVLRAVHEGELADRALRRAARGLPPRDRAWLLELTLGTFRLRGRLDHALAVPLDRPLEKLDPVVRDVLRLGAYQILEMDGVPAYAAVSQSVELAKPAGRGAAGLVNAVLKAVELGRESIPYPEFEKDPIAHLSTWGSHPLWLVERWVARFGAAAAKDLTRSNNSRPELYLRPIGLEVPDALVQWTRAGVAVEGVEGTRSVRLGSGQDLELALAAVPAIVQDPAAGLVVDAVEAPGGALIADPCAAPGGKAIALAGTTRASPRLVVASDLSPGRLEKLRENVTRLPGVAVIPLVADARMPALRAVDAVLLDVPCSGTGTFRRHPDGKWRIGPEDIRTLSALQAQMLEAAASLVATGGLLVYATCSLEPEENEAQVERFLARHGEYVEEPPGGIDPGHLDGVGRLRVVPHVQGFDGAFAARLRRRY